MEPIIEKPAIPGNSLLAQQMLTIMFFAYRTAYLRTVLFLLAFFAGGNLSATWQPALSADELRQLGSLATSQHQRTLQRSTSKSNNPAMLGIEILMIELQEKKSVQPSDPRLAEVFIFDYATNRASVQLIDADTLEFMSKRDIEHIHLPLNQREQNITLQILANDQTLTSALEHEYVEQFGQPLNSLEQIDMKVSIWEPGPNDTKGTFCKLTRCALVSVFTHNFYNFSIEPIVELQNATVHLDIVQ